MNTPRFYKRLNRFWAAVSLLILTGLLTHPAQANLLINGGFEDLDVADGSWQILSSGTPGLAWQGGNVEIWDSVFGFKASEGEQLAELNAHPGQSSYFTLFQSFNTRVNQLYQLSFDYAARHNGHEAFQVDVSGLTNRLSRHIDDHTPFSWSHFSGTFLADSALTTLRFTSANHGTVGNLLDNVSVRVIPEPDLLFPMLLFILAVMVYLSRRKLSGS